MHLSEPDRNFVLDTFEGHGQFAIAKTAPFGFLQPVADASLGFEDAHRLASILGVETRPNGSELRVRLRGTDAESILNELLPRLNETSRGIAASVLERAAVIRERREARRRNAAR